MGLVYSFKSSFIFFFVFRLLLTFFETFPQKGPSLSSQNNDLSYFEEALPYACLKAKLLIPFASKNTIPCCGIVLQVLHIVQLILIVY